MPDAQRIEIFNTLKSKWGIPYQTIKCEPPLQKHLVDNGRIVAHGDGCRKSDATPRHRSCTAVAVFVIT
jgi:hypothetical protein